MRDFRDIKRKARRDLHERMKVAATYHVDGASGLAVHVRVHTKVDALGALQQTAGYAEQVEFVPKLIFDLDEIPEIALNAVVVIDATEAYEVVELEPVYGFTRTAHVRALRPAEIAELGEP